MGGKVITLDGLSPRKSKKRKLKTYSVTGTRVCKAGAWMETKQLRSWEVNAYTKKGAVQQANRKWKVKRGMCKVNTHVEEI